MAHKTTVRDVAAAAGVSPATASRALSGHPSVNPEMARRVLKASHELGYSANVFARALRTQRTDTIGMVVPSISNPYFVVAVEAVEKVLADTDRSLILCDSRDSVATESARINLLVQRMVDGLLVIPVSTEGSAAALRTAACQVPLVQFDRFADGAGTDFVGSDDGAGIRQCIDHLRSRGCANVAYVGARPSTSTAAERLRAFLDHTADRPVPDHWVQLDDFSAEWGRRAADAMLQAGPLPDGIVCGADVIAVSLLSTLRAASVDVPREVMVVSYDDSTLGSLTVPSLTSVRQPVASMAREAVRLLDHRARHADASIRKSVFDPQLVVRDSSGG